MAPTLAQAQAVRLANPFVGIRPFDTDDSAKFFGRDEQVDSLLRKLRQTRFVAAVGSSGCGKSSLVRAGLIPALRGGFLVAEREAWHTLKMQPGDDPMRRLAAALRDGASDPAAEVLAAKLLVRVPTGSSSSCTRCWLRTGTC
jgi:hypothetical protein